MKRKLASIQKITSLEPISGADKIETATVLGWRCVVPKDIHKINELVVYIEIDSLIPFASWSEFLFKNGRTGNHRLKTIRLKGQVSQGLIMPITLMTGGWGAEALSEGQDVSEILGIKKYEPEIPANLQGVIKSTFPSWIPKTDEERIQTWPHILEYLQGQMMVATEKLDGSSMTVYLRDGEFGVCSRNMDLKESEGNSYWATARKIDLENKLRSLNRNISIQGELIGPGVQKNKYKLTELQFRAFNVFDIDHSEYVLDTLGLTLLQDLNIDRVPTVAMLEFDNMTVEKLVELSKGNSALNKEALREGLVFRSLNDIKHPKYGRISFKIINPDFLIKYDE